jgi:hypothetical protein
LPDGLFFRGSASGNKKGLFGNFRLRRWFFGMAKQAAPAARKSYLGNYAAKASASSL